MIVYVNGEKISGDFVTLQDLFNQVSQFQDCSATAVNGDFIPKIHREQTMLSQGDHIDIVIPLEGG